MAVHLNHDGTDTKATSPTRFDYTYQPDNLHATGNLQPTFQCAGYYAHASSAVNVMPVRAYDPTPDRRLDRDPLPAK